MKKIYLTPSIEVRGSLQALTAMPPTDILSLRRPAPGGGG